jgi:hypothetical protein
MSAAFLAGQHPVLTPDDSGPNPGNNGSGGQSSPPQTSGDTTQGFLNYIQSKIGDQYVLGATGPQKFDCSGLIVAGLESVGITGFARTSEEQYKAVQRIKKSQLQPGDLVFSQWPGDSASPGHVEVYIGNNQITGAEDPAQGVASHSLDEDTGHIVGYGRIPQLSGNAQLDVSITGNPFGTILNWLGFGGAANAVGGGLGISGLPSAGDLAERGGLILMGAILVIVGLIVLTRDRAGHGQAIRQVRTGGPDSE